MPVLTALMRKAATPETIPDNRTAVEGFDSPAAAMDCALGLEKRKSQGHSRWNEHAIEFAWSFAPVICELFSLAVKVCVELELNWLSLALPAGGARLGVSAAPVAGESREQWMDSLARSMDVAAGVETEMEAVPPFTGRKPEGRVLPIPAETVPRRARSAAAGTAA